MYVHLSARVGASQASNILTSKKHTVFFKRTGYLKPHTEIPWTNVSGNLNIYCDAIEWLHTRSPYATVLNEILRHGEDTTGADSNLNEWLHKKDSAGINNVIKWHTKMVNYGTMTDGGRRNSFKRLTRRNNQSAGGGRKNKRNKKSRNNNKSNRRNNNKSNRRNNNKSNRRNSSHKINSNF